MCYLRDRITKRYHPPSIARRSHKESFTSVSDIPRILAILTILRMAPLLDQHLEESFRGFLKRAEEEEEYEEEELKRIPKNPNQEMNEL